YWSEFTLSAPVSRATSLTTSLASFGAPVLQQNVSSPNAAIAFLRIMCFSSVLIWESFSFPEIPVRGLCAFFSTSIPRIQLHSHANATRLHVPERDRSVMHRKIKTKCWRYGSGARYQEPGFLLREVQVAARKVSRIRLCGVYSHCPKFQDENSG